MKYLTIQVEGSVIIEGGSLTSKGTIADCENGQPIRIVARDNVIVDGKVESVAISSGFGKSVTIIAENGAIDVDNDALVRSMGPTGGGKVTLAACSDIKIRGQVSSGNTSNTAEIELYSHLGNVTIDVLSSPVTTAVKPGVNAALSNPQGGRGKVTVQAHDNITVVGKSGTNDPFAIDVSSGMTNQTGGTILLRSSEGIVDLSNRALKGSATASGARGGDITMESKGSIAIKGLLDDRGGSLGGGSNTHQAIVSLRAASASSNIDITPINIIRIDAGPGYPGKSYDPQVILKTGGMINGESATTIKPFNSKNIQEFAPTLPPVLVPPPEIQDVTSNR